MAEVSFDNVRAIYYLRRLPIPVYVSRLPKKAGILAANIFECLFCQR